MPYSVEEQKKISQAGRYGLIDFSIITLPSYRPNWHHEILANKLEAVERGEIKRLMVMMPPRYGKSELISIRFPAWFLGRNPQKEIIATSYNADLSVEFGGKTRDVIADPVFGVIFPEGITLKEDEQAKGRWRTNKGGSYTSAGIGGPITGRGSHILLIDDPIKNREEAESKLIRDKQWDWYRSTAYTRLEKDAAIILVLTRWHLDDLAGRLLEEEKEGGEKWEVVKFPAIAIADEQYRKQGEPLWPEKYSLTDLEQTKRTVGIYNWSSLYQQEALLSENQEFKPAFIKIRNRSEVEVLDTRKFLTIDTAYSQKTESDYCGVVKNYVDKENKWNLSAFRVKLSPGELINLIFTLYKTDFYEKIGIEKTAYLAGLKPYLDEEQRKRNVFLPIVELEHKEVNKHTRIRGLLPRYESGSVFHLAGECDDLEEEMVAFPKGSLDDVLDACAYQLQLAEPPENSAYKMLDIQRTREERKNEFI